jgi:hypothetical protein
MRTHLVVSSVAAILLVFAAVPSRVLHWSTERLGYDFLSDAVLGSIFGTDPDTGTYSAAGLCEGGSLDQDQVSQYSCPGNPGAECVVCDPGTYTMLKPAVGFKYREDSAGSCATDEKKVGICYRGPDTNFMYICKNPVGTTPRTDCTGAPPYITQQPESR